MIFNKPLKEIAFEDVLSFCELQVKENEVLDYKKYFPSKLDKTIAAFANTYGGLIIIGVGENDGKPVKKPKGIVFSEGLEERVQSIIHSNITPAVFPEIQVCKPVKNKTFVLIQIPQSTNTPHAISENTKVYIRTGNITKPEKLINLDELHWLNRHRQNAASFKGELHGEALRKFGNLYSMSGATIDFAELHMSCTPVYPSMEGKASIRSLKDKIHNISIRTEGGSSYPSNHIQFTPMKDGIYLYSNNRNDYGEFTEFTLINKWGLIYHVEDMGSFEGEKEENNKVIYLSRVVGHFVNLLKFYKNLKDELMIWGDFEITLILQKMLNIQPIPFVPNNFRSEKLPISSDKKYIFKRKITPSLFDNSDELIDLVVDFTSDLHWSYGDPRSENVFRQIITEKINFN